MNFLYDSEKIESAMLDFRKATGVNICLIKEDLSYAVGISTIVTLAKKYEPGYCSKIKSIEKARRCCIKCDCDILKKCSQSGKMEMHICHAGLVDIAIPVVYGKKILCYIILGQMKKNTDFNSVKKYLSETDLDIDEMKNYYDALPLYDEDRIESIANLAVMLARNIMFEKMLMPKQNQNIEIAVKYIEDNIAQEITVDDITRNSGISKTVLYKNFREFFDCTVNEYINNARVEKADEYLVNTDMSMDEIAQMVGFRSATYFSQVFKKIEGISPLKFRKIKKKEKMSFSYVNE